jgi:hypothetical protein
MQERVAAGYEATLAELAAAGQRIAILDGEAAIDDVTAAIAAVVQSFLGSSILSTKSPM